MTCRRRSTTGFWRSSPGSTCTWLSAYPPNASGRSGTRAISSGETSRAAARASGRRAVCLAAAALDVRGSHAFRDQPLGDIDGASRELARAGVQAFVVAHEFDVALHVLRGPPERVTDVREG